MIKIAMASLGCAKNSVDAENMLGILTVNGCEIVGDESEADVIIVNTCCFINDAKQESIDTIIDLARNKTEGKCRRLIVSGCLAERYKDEIINELPEVDVVVGVGHIGDIMEAVNGGEKSVMASRPYYHPESERVRITPPYTAYLKIADGCDNRCTYCIIPSVRGSFNSRPVETLVAEARELARQGVKELIIVAQDSTKYGVDLPGEPSLAQLVSRLCEVDGIEWIRLHYCYPERITDELIDVIASEAKVCKYLDIPIQHCNKEVLRKMGRKGSKDTLAAAIGKIRARIPGITLRTTIIVGFPTETDEQYSELAEFVREMKFARLGVFTYSQEEGTPAAKMSGQIDEEVKERRREMLMLAQADVSDELSAAKEGTTIRVLVEGYDAIVKQYYGRSEADSAEIDGKVFFTSKMAVKEGTFTDVIIENSMDCDLFGRIAE